MAIATVTDLGLRLINRLRRPRSHPGIELSPSPEPHPLAVQAHGLSDASRAIEAILVKNLLPFWRTRLAPPGDCATAAYPLHHDTAGRPLGRTNVRLVAQARTLWFFARLVRRGCGDAGDLEIAARGFAFMAERLWDDRYGGFYWEVDPWGRRPTKAGKHLYGHAFALFALAEYAAASDSEQAAALARETFTVLERRFHDPEFAGYHEFWRRDWSEPPARRGGYLGATPAVKLLNSHLHVLEGLIAYFLLTRDPLARARLVEVADVLGGAAVRRPHFACSDRHRRDWTTAGSDGHPEPVSYGHDLENVHLLIGAREAVGSPNAPWLDLYRGLFANALRFGEDRRHGGFFAGGPPGAPADDTRKIWWVQAEALLAAIEMHRLTGDPLYADCFLRTLNWIVNWQVDWECGEWFAEIGPDWRAAGPKAGAWKAPYHTGRSMLGCLDSLRRISAAGGL